MNTADVEVKLKQLEGRITALTAALVIQHGAGALDVTDKGAFQDAVIEAFKLRCGIGPELASWDIGYAIYKAHHMTSESDIRNIIQQLVDVARVNGVDIR